MIVVVGDIHGEIRKAVWTLVERYKIADCHVFFAGDFGVGFNKPGWLESEYVRIKKRLEKNNLILHVVRGNHDDPSWFDGSKHWDRLILEPDWKVIEVDGARILPIGGAVSTDRRYRTVGVDWWEGEDVTRVQLKDVPRNIDIVISHEAPISFEPVIVRKSSEIDVDDWRKIVDSREYLDSVFQEITKGDRLKYWIHGHYHKSTSGSINRAIYKGLGINEVIRIVI